MMNFPDSPTIGQTYSSSTYNWIWNGRGWEVLNRNGNAFVQMQHSREYLSITTINAEAVSIDIT
jgi:hypothetical protein